MVGIDWNNDTVSVILLQYRYQYRTVSQR